MSVDEIRKVILELEIKNNVYAKEIWNAAIEKAAVVGSEESNLCCDRNDGFKENVAAVIRKLKV